MVVPDSTRPGEDATYDPQFYEILSRTEDKHFWHRARNKIIRAALTSVVSGLPSGYRVLEVGCGNGNVLRTLESVCDRATVVGMDLYSEGFSMARNRVSCALVQADLRQPPFTAVFDVVGLFDVLEHLPDDRKALLAVRSILTERGVLLLTVPAHPSLWSYLDEIGLHRRRYTEDDLADELLQAGFTVEYMSQFMAILFPLMWLVRRIRMRRYRGAKREPTEEMRVFADELRIVPGVNGLLALLLEQEAHLVARGKRLPIGTSLLAVARKKP